MKIKLNKIINYLLILLLISLFLVFSKELIGINLPRIILVFNSGLIGALLTIIITLFLLNRQTNIADQQAKGSVIYQEKLNIFNKFLSTINSCLKGGQLTVEEMKNIIFHFALVRIHINQQSSDKIGEALQSIQPEFFYLNENNIPRLDLYERVYEQISLVLKNELYAKQAHFDSTSDFNLSNFSEILHYSKSNLLPIQRIHQLVELYSKNPNVIHFDSDDKPFMFRLDSQKVKLFEDIFNEVKELITKTEFDRPFTIFEINQFSLNDVLYNGLARIHFRYNGTKPFDFAELYISHQNKLYLEIPILGKTLSFYIENQKDLEDCRDEIQQTFVKASKIYDLA